jgi:hypothetical protein
MLMWHKKGEQRMIETSEQKKSIKRSCVYESYLILSSGMDTQRKLTSLRQYSSSMVYYFHFDALLFHVSVRF